MNITDNLNIIEGILSDDDFDWDSVETDDAEYFVHLCYSIERTSRKPLLSCGGADLSDTPTSLYRLLYWFAPSSVDFSDMYKCCLMQIYSPCGRFTIHVDLFKYELGLRYYCAKDVLCVKGEGNYGIIAGQPSADNKTYCGDDVGNNWFRVIKLLLETKYEIYGGNYFSV